jgi:hypothetical protein
MALIYPSNVQPFANRWANRADYRAAYAADQPDDRWVVAANGDEVPFLRQNRWCIRVWNPRTVTHGILDIGTDIVTDETNPWD